MTFWRSTLTDSVEASVMMISQVCAVVQARKATLVHFHETLPLLRLQLLERTEVYSTLVRVMLLTARSPTQRISSQSQSKRSTTPEEQLKSSEHDWALMNIVVDVDDERSRSRRSVVVVATIAVMIVDDDLFIFC